ncbi:MAG: hypothetical protein GY804_09415 [Alphaproteobacteria bacterium]|nr:hypothetical protein [Alphaproteobacteria bacterium]
MTIPFLNNAIEADLAQHYGFSTDTSMRMLGISSDSGEEKEEDLSIAGLNSNIFDVREDIFGKLSVDIYPQHLHDFCNDYRQIILYLSSLSPDAQINLKLSWFFTGASGCASLMSMIKATKVHCIADIRMANIQALLVASACKHITINETSLFVIRPFNIGSHGTPRAVVNTIKADMAQLEGMYQFAMMRGLLTQEEYDQMQTDHEWIKYIYGDDLKERVDKFNLSN